MRLATWRIIDMGPLDPVSNMAFDEAILRGYELYNSPPTLRIYGWQPAGISIGYSQDPDQMLDMTRCRRDSMPVVRRITGGGMIVHADEITYSFVASKADLGLSAHVASSYKIVAQFLMKFYKTLGIDADFAHDAASKDTLGAPTALCFAGREKYDIVVSGKKIGGSAQKRIKDVIFQHGSIPLYLDIKKSEHFLRNSCDAACEDSVTSLEKILGRPLNYAILTEMLIDSFTQSFNINGIRGTLSEDEKDVFADLKRLKYGSDEWNIKRIDQTKEKRVCM